MDSNPVTVSSRTRPAVRVLISQDGAPQRAYQLDEEIGRGAAATVWRARDRGAGREVAVKVLHEEHMGHPKAVARFLQERSILLGLRHPNIVRVHDLLSTSDGALALVMDLVHGGNLREYLTQRRTLPTGEAAALLAQVADALGAAHERSVVHRDLKPNNVLVDRDLDGSPRARLTDFGIARVLDSPGMTTVGAVVGTPNYMAPELIEGGRPTPAVDVYALGMMFYELLVGRPPYADRVQSAILMHHLGSAPRRAGIPKPAWQLIQSCVARDPAARPSAAQLGPALRRVARQTAGCPALPVLSADEPEVPRPVRPRRAASVSVAAAALVVVAVVVVVVVAGASRRLFADRSGAGAGGDAGTAALGRAPGSRGAGTSVRVAGGAGTPVDPAAASGAGEPSASRGPAAEPEAVVPLDSTPPLVAPLPGTYGPWHCAGDRTALGHPVSANACYATDGALRVRATVKAAPSVRVDVTTSVRDADAGTTVGSRVCPAVASSGAQPEPSCGPFDLSPPRGHRYVVVVSWTYTDVRRAPGGSVQGDPFPW